MTKIGKIAATILAIMCGLSLILFTISICIIINCNYSLEHRYCEYGDFRYEIITDDETGEQYVRLQGLTKQAQKQKYVVVPSEIEGIRVRELNHPAYFSLGGSLKSEVLEKIYLPYGIEVYPMGAFGYCKKLRTIILNHIPDDIDEIRYDYMISDVYISSSKRSSESLETSNLYFFHYPDGETGRKIKVRFANVSFMYNYEESLYSGYYWIDDCKYGGKIEYVPENPEREGYEFGGWYKEPECVNVWDFDKDTLPQAKWNNDGEEIYQETKLFAKWNKK